jgi:hypothetical protein
MQQSLQRGEAKYPRYAELSDARASFHWNFNKHVHGSRAGDVSSGTSAPTAPEFRTLTFPLADAIEVGAKVEPTKAAKGPAHDHGVGRTDVAINPGRLVA